MVHDWQPVCELAQLRQRAQLLADIRRFFLERDVLEVETPLLCRTTGTDPHLDFFATALQAPPLHTPLFLQTSPEFAMKRLLAAGSGSIYQICKAFRNGESGQRHNPEFSMLEWYRVGFSLADLMDELAELLLGLFKAGSGQINEIRLSYRELFLQATQLDPLLFELTDYREFAVARQFPEAVDLCGDEHALWLDFLFSHCVQASMRPNHLYLVYDYPAVLSSLARSHPQDARVCERFEVFFNSLELGNGFFELADATEQAQRFEAEVAYRQVHGLPAVTIDQRFLAALSSGLPDCSGVAIGLDRLLMVLSGHRHIDEVLAFPLKVV